MTLTPGKLILDQSPEVLYDSNESPSLDLRFAENKTLDDYVSGTPLVDHQRSMSGSNLSAGTFVNSSGLIETAKVNLLTYSEEFSPNWLAGTATVSAAPSVRSPTGTTNTKELSVGIRYAPLSYVTAGNQYTFSIYVRSAGLNTQFALISQGGFTGARTTIFNIIDGTLVSSDPGVDNYSITSFPNGWYRVSQTDTAEISVNTTWHIESVNSSAYIWGAQLEEGSTATTYIPTTNVPSAAPRFDHNLTTGESLGLLIEESRTNQLKYSGNLDNSPNWTTGGGSTANTTAPDGTNDAVIFTENTATDYHGIVGSGVNRPTMSGDITASVYIKPGTRRYVLISFGSGTNGVCVTVDTQNMTVSEATAYGTGYTYTNNSATIVSASNGWYRVSFAGNSSGSNAQVFIIRGTNIATGNTFGESYLGDGSTFSVWGAQLEAGRFATSYIPTAGTALTRNVDVASITGTNFSSWYNQSEGTVFIDHTRINTASTYYAFDISDATASNRLSNYATNTNEYFLAVSGGANYLNAAVASTSGLPHKKAFAYAVNDLQGAIDGTTPAAWKDLVAPSMPTMTRMYIGYGVTIPTVYSQRISRLTYYPYRLADTRLQSLTA